MEQEVRGLPDIESGDIGEFSRLKDEIAQGKVGATLDVVKEILNSSDSKVLVFSDSVKATKDIAAKFGNKAILHHGQMSDDAREAAKAEFQRRMMWVILSPKSAFLSLPDNPWRLVRR